MKLKNIFLTTTLPYVNSSGKGVAHIGHALEFLQADAYSRYFRSEGHYVHFNLGLDEHGKKVYEKATSLGLSPQQHCDIQAKHWKEFLELLQIKYDSFYRTSSQEHKERFTLIWNELKEKGFLERKKYSGKYCVGCESYKLDKDLVDGKCSDHDIEPEFISEEENWFFLVSKFKDEKYNSTLYPKHKIEELKNQILAASDLSVSRSKENVHWGIFVPDVDDEIVYVWLEALSNYIICSQSTDYFKWDECQTIQIFGPDNLRFQGHLFQTLLSALGHKHTDVLLCHGTVLDSNGRKMSKAVGNVIDPIEQIEKYGFDAFKYYTLCGLPTFENSKWNEKDLVNLYNDNLANNYGNLLSRVLHLITIKNVDFIKDGEVSFLKLIREHLDRYDNCWLEYDIQSALIELNNLFSLGNKYINDNEPWKSKDPQQVLSNLYWLLYIGTKKLSVILPEKCDLALNALKKKEKINLFPRIS